MKPIKLRDHPELEGVAIYYKTNGKGVDRFFYSRNGGKSLYPKDGEYAPGGADRAATDADLKKKASKRKPLKLSVSLVHHEEGRVTHERGTCTGYTFQHDGGLVVQVSGRSYGRKQSERFGGSRSYGHMPRLTVPGDKNLDRLEARYDEISKARSELRRLEELQAADTKLSCFEPPRVPDVGDDKARIVAEEELQRAYDAHAQRVANAAAGKLLFVEAVVDSDTKQLDWSEPAAYLGPMDLIASEYVDVRRYVGNFAERIGYTSALASPIQERLDMKHSGGELVRGGVDVHVFEVGEEGSTQIVFVATPEAAAEADERLSDLSR